ncbi:TPA: hypothetical protein N0F65_001117 [Lagenidium giganteum]|uniref:Uncharacterized protein n=1 Tax=Lagenidium giganteum TaxID=4803 RepID=A0AAV2YKN6_9STRA|nr:TPA: hypothetical protein N0F65_001117 [Lagenidium giganteum]
MAVDVAPKAGAMSEMALQGLHQALVTLAQPLGSSTASSTSATTATANNDALDAALRLEVEAKLPFMDPSWGRMEAAAIDRNAVHIAGDHRPHILFPHVPFSLTVSLANTVSRVDECTIALQECTKKEFLDPLSFDLAPHSAVLATVRAVLLLFHVQVPRALDGEALWKNCWGLWIIKNIDTHRSGWEWAATNEPTGLFTKPYALSATSLREVNALLKSTTMLPDSHRCWQRLRAYLCLRNWAMASAAYVHMRTHCLPEFPGFEDMKKLVTPPARTPQANVWFRIETPEGVEYFYNRLAQSVQLARPDDFDGQYVTTIPLVVRELIADALANDPVTRLELEKCCSERRCQALFAEDEWVECLDVRTQETFYYSFKHFKLQWEPPESGFYISYTKSIAYAAVLRLQAAYRRRRLQQRLLMKKTKRASLPVFSLGPKRF